MIPLAFAVVFAVLMGVGFPWVVGRGQGTRKRITPRRTIAVALLTLGAVFASSYVAVVIPGLISGCLRVPDTCLEYGGSSLTHPIWHFSWALLATAIAFGLHRFRRAWSATGWTERCLATADLLVRGIAVGNLLAAVGAAIWSQSYRDGGGLLGGLFHTPGELLGFGSFLILPVVCLVMLGVGIRGALRPTTAQAS